MSVQYSELLLKPPREAFTRFTLHCTTLFVHPSGVLNFMYFVSWLLDNQARFWGVEDGEERDNRILHANGLVGIQYPSEHYEFLEKLVFCICRIHGVRDPFLVSFKAIFNKIKTLWRVNWADLHPNRPFPFQQTPVLPDGYTTQTAYTELKTLVDKRMRDDIIMMGREFNDLDREFEELRNTHQYRDGAPHGPRVMYYISDHLIYWYFRADKVQRDHQLYRVLHDLYALTARRVNKPNIHHKLFKKLQALFHQAEVVDTDSIKVNSRMSNDFRNNYVLLTHLTTVVSNQRRYREKEMQAKRLAFAMSGHVRLGERFALARDADPRLTSTVRDMDCDVMTQIMHLAQLY